MLAKCCVVLNSDFVACPSYPLSSPALSPTERLPFGLEENGGTPFAPKASGRHHHQHQHQHHSNYGLSLTLENKEGPLRSPNSSKALTSECVEGAGWGWEGQWGTGVGGVAIATRLGQLGLLEPDPQRQGRLEFPPAPCTEDHSFLLPSLDLCCALRWLPGSSSGEEERGESDSGWGS